MLLKFVSFDVSSGATAPDLMRRRLASPDGVTRSYCPPPPERNLGNISSEVPAGTAFTLQPVCFVKVFANDLSAYPSHTTRLSWPSPFLFTSGPLAVDPDLQLVGGPPRVHLEPARQKGVRRLDVVAQDPLPAQSVDDQRRAQIPAVR